MSAAHPSRPRTPRSRPLARTIAARLPASRLAAAAAVCVTFAAACCSARAAAAQSENKPRKARRDQRLRGLKRSRGELSSRRHCCGLPRFGAPCALRSRCPVLQARGVFRRVPSLCTCSRPRLPERARGCVGARGARSLTSPEWRSDGKTAVRSAGRCRCFRWPHCRRNAPLSRPATAAAAAAPAPAAAAVINVVDAPNGCGRINGGRGGGGGASGGAPELSGRKKTQCGFLLVPSCFVNLPLAQAGLRARLPSAALPAQGTMAAIDRRGEDIYHAHPEAMMKRNGAAASNAWSGTPRMAVPRQTRRETVDTLHASCMHVHTHRGPRDRQPSTGTLP
eukprot:11679-Chlamydomonas_euryale.AAC.8